MTLWRQYTLISATITAFGCSPAKTPAPGSVEADSAAVHLALDSLPSLRGDTLVLDALQHAGDTVIVRLRGKNPRATDLPYPIVWVIPGQRVARVELRGGGN